ncbi:MAG: choline dehydrogenase [Pseudomonadota bacterium]|nr:choline dehydrogenase [Pseudomonadota bacterium]
MERFDYVIVGGGSAGCVLASRLSEDPSVRVCLVEAGPAKQHWSIDMPAGIIKTMTDRKHNWMFETEPQARLDNRRLYWPRGKVMGGSSAINAMVYIRGNRADYDRWAGAEGCPGWGWDEVLPYFRRAENNERFQDDLHGVGGPLNVADLRSPNPLTGIFVQAAAETQLPVLDDFNGPRQEGAGLYQVTQKDGNRMSAFRAYLADVVRPNLKIVDMAQATRVEIDHGRASCVAYRRGGREETVAAEREIILCGGAVNSPQLLMLSGIGPGAELQRHGIAVVADRAGVGANLQDHLDVSLVQKTVTKLGFAFTPAGFAMIPKAIRDYRRNRTGLLTSNYAEGGLFAKSDPALDLPDLQYHFLPVLVNDHGRKRIYAHGMTMHCCDLRPKSRGRIGLKSPDPLAAPLIDPNYLDHADDMAKLKRGLALARRIFSAPALNAHAGEELFPGAAVQSDAEVERFIRSKAETIYHPVGTCRMGSDADAVVDPQLRVRGVDGLRVVDASVMPSLIGGNTNAPTIMIAERAADLIRGRIAA